jgi:phage shock protein A
MFKRFFRYLRALIMGKLDQLEDPQVIIDEALREMKENQIKNRERAVQAATERNKLKDLVDKEEKMTANLERQAEISLQQGNRELARQCLREKAQHDATLQNLRVSLKQAEDAVEAVKTAIRREEERFRVKTAEALALKANMKQAQIQIQINKALDSLQSDETAQSWDRAEERIRSMQAEAQARAEIASQSISSKIAQMEDVQVDAESEKALQEMEARLGLTQTTPVTTATQTSAATTGAQESDIDRQLRELEQRLNQQ